MKYAGLIIGIVFLLIACGPDHSQHTHADPLPAAIEPVVREPPEELIFPHGDVIQSRIRPPAGYRRVEAAPESFAFHLRQLPLKPHGAKVMLYNGRLKARDVHEAVVDLPVGNKDLHQCADAIMRLRAEYLYAQQRFDQIHFNFTNGFRVDYAEWMKGKRIAVTGSEVRWVQKTDPSNSSRDLWNYLETLFTYAGTLSLEKELKPASVNELKIGDIFIQGGSPGHAVIVVDLAENELTGEKLFLLAQSYMPAQEIHILKNFNDESISPWYSIDSGESLATPEWNFRSSDLKRFED